MKSAFRDVELARTDGELGGTPFPYPVQVVQFGGELALVALASEVVVVDYSLRLKQEISQEGAAVWVAGYSNGYFGYIPSVRILNEGGYEAGPWEHDAGPWPKGDLAICFRSPPTAGRLGCLHEGDPALYAGVHPGDSFTVDRFGPDGEAGANGIVPCGAAFDGARTAARLCPGPRRNFSERH